MRILLYVEPHPIRNSKTHFIDVARGFLPLLASADPKLDVRMYANANTVSTLGEAVASLKPRLIAALPTEEELFDRYMTSWQDDAIGIWLQLMEGEGDVSAAYNSVLKRIWRQFPFDVIIHWGENGAVTNFCKAFPVTRIAMELGCTRAPFFESLVMDVFGTNGSAIIPKLSIAEIRDIVQFNPMSRQEALMAYSQNLETLPYEQQFAPLPGDIGERLASATGPTAFLPLQLYDDANLLRFSPYNSVTEVVLDVVPKLAEKGYTILIKPHPASKHRPGSEVANAMAKRSLQQWSRQIVWCGEPGIVYDNARLINASDVVVTVNSSVGFEALYFDKPVVVLGDAVYKPRDLFPTLDDVLDGRFDKLSYMENTSYLRRFFLGGYLQAQRIRTDVSAFSSTIGLLSRLRERHGDDALAIAQGFWRALAPPTAHYAESAAFSGLSKPGDRDFGVPSVLDPGNVASPVEAQKAHTGPWLRVARRLLDHSECDSVEELAAWLKQRLFGSPRERLEVVKAGGLIDPDYYLETHADVRDEDQHPVEHFVLYGFAEGRKALRHGPALKLDSALSVLCRAAEAVLDSDYLREYALTEEQASARQKVLAEISNAVQSSVNKVAVVAHLYYTDLVPELIERLTRIPEEFDLVVTLPDWGSKKTKELVLASFPTALFYEAANRGRDIGPFLDVLPCLISRNYDAVLKIQTKRGYYQAGRLLSEFGDLWREQAYDALLGSSGRVASILDEFREEDALAIVGPSEHYLSLSNYPYHDGGFVAGSLLGDDEGGGFFAGTMFWVRPSALEPLVGDGRLCLTSFAPETGDNDGALAHLVERMFGHASTISGKYAIGAPVDSDAGLDYHPVPAGVSMHQYLSEALLKRKEEEKTNAKAKSALAW